MHPLKWSLEETKAVIAAIKHVCTEAQAIPLLPIHVSFLEGFRDYIFQHSELDLTTVRPMTPADFAARMPDPQHRSRALEYLTLAPYIQPDVSPAQADLVAAFFRAVGEKSDAMTFLNHVAHRHMLMGQLCLGRKLLPHLLPGGPVRQMTRALRMLRESRGDSKIAAQYAALAELPAGSLGNAFYRFHRNRGFALPGEVGCVPEELSSLHDLTHLLAGYNTDSAGEISAQAFAGGSMKAHGMMAAVTGLLSFHNGLLFDAGGRFALPKGNLDPRTFARAFARGMDSICLIDGWDFKADWEKPVSEVRARFRIAGAEDVWDKPPTEQRAAAPNPMV